MESFAILCFGTNLAVGVVTSSALFFLYVVTRFEVYLFASTNGAGGLVAALAVGLKLVAPREPVVLRLPGGGGGGIAPLASVPGLTHAHLPMLLVACSLVAWALGAPGGLGADAPFVVVGTFAGWWYLRFVHRDPVLPPARDKGNIGSSSDAGFGDTSPEFAFVTLFPPGMRRYLAPLSDFTYGVCMLLGFFKDRKRTAYPAAAAAEHGGNHDALHPNPHTAMLLAGGGRGGVGALALGDDDGPGTAATDPVAERRRAIAREQLDAKLAAMAAADDEDQWGDNDEEQQAAAAAE